MVCLHRLKWLRVTLYLVLIYIYIYEYQSYRRHYKQDTEKRKKYIMSFRLWRALTTPYQRPNTHLAPWPAIYCYLEFVNQELSAHDITLTVLILLTRGWNIHTDCIYLTCFTFVLNLCKPRVSFNIRITMWYKVFLYKLASCFGFDVVLLLISSCIYFLYTG